MTDIATLLQVAGSVALVALPAIVLNRLLAGAEGPTLADLFAEPLDPPWPRGVQEDEPVRWRVEHLHPRRETHHADAPEPRQAGRPAPAFETERGPCG